MKKKGILHTIIKDWRYEFLTFSLLMVIFNKIFFEDQDFYLSVIWPLNMVLLALASFGIYDSRNKSIYYFKNTLAAISLIVPFIFTEFLHIPWFALGVLIVFTLYYTLMLATVLYQISFKKEVNVSVILGSLSGYFLLILVCTFSLLICEYILPNSFKGLSSKDLSLIYNDISYFSIITISSIGYGDITPNTNTARLTTSFFGILGQFYMVVIVGIIISKYVTSSNKKNEI